jgi:hypothetical protein
MFVWLFRMPRQHPFDSLNERANSAPKIAPMCHDEGYGTGSKRSIGAPRLGLLAVDVDHKFGL